ncbi:TolC family protein, partial [candidate division WOR-3 bacterium]|nr:TolC family protein [candidate division WOR-3 bacterium]
LGIVEAGAESRRARAAARAARLQLRSTALAAVIGYEEALRRHDYAARNLELNERLYELAREQHRLGNISLLELLTVESGLAAAAASRISALCDTHIQAAQVSYLLGSAEPPELVE